MTHRPRTWGAVLLVGAVLVLPAAGLADPPAVLQVIGVKLKGDLDTYVQKIKKGQAIAKRLGTAVPRAWRATLAGEDTGTIYVASEHKSLAAFAEAQAKLAADPEWQSFMKDLDQSGIRTVASNELLQELTP